MKLKLFDIIRNEAKKCSRRQVQAYIIAQNESLSNQEMIDELYAASQAGVKIDLNCYVEFAV